jgi:RNA polymerase sigma-70 factor (ECF subfamily)
MVNTFKNRVRRPWWQRMLPLTNEIAENLVGSDPGEGYAARRKLERAFQAISPEDQALVTLFELEGWSVAEIAALKGKSEGAIKVRLLRARRKMREALARFRLKTKTVKKVKPALTEDEICVVAKPDAN